MEQLQYARLGVEGGVWQLFAEDGEMKMYKREEEVDGVAVDPLKAVHTVKGVTGREMTHYFFSPDVRFEWESKITSVSFCPKKTVITKLVYLLFGLDFPSVTFSFLFIFYHRLATVEQMKVLETIADDTLVILQIHKRVWPASQRDALFWSHVRRVPNDTDRDAQDIWIACNHSTEHHEAPVFASLILYFDLIVSHLFLFFFFQVKRRENGTCLLDGLFSVSNFYRTTSRWRTRNS